ncbi:MAG TPA: cation:proton antiporter [Anaerolineales bacterium]|nr:cation:proton antiporter [Anaerolineales bacterium]
MEENLSFIPLLLVVFLAFIVPLLLTRLRALRLPIVVGEILAGILIGRSGFKLVGEHEPMLDLLAEFGFVFLMFLSGMEIDFSNLALLMDRGQASKNRWNPVTLGGLNFGLTLVLSLGLGFTFVGLGLARNPWMMALILSTTSLGVVVPVLKERGLTGGQFGQAVLIAALIADFVTMLLITIGVAALSSGITLDILLVGLLFVAFFLMYHFGMFFFNRLKAVRRILEELSHASTQIKVRAAFTMMLIFVALSEVLGAEVILGAFLAGAIVALLRRSEDAELIPKLEAIGFGFFIPIFFIMVGVDFNLEVLYSSTQAILLAPILLLAAIAVKIIPSLVMRLRFTWREALAAGSLLSARLSLIIAASAIGLRLGVISEPVNAAIILVAILTVTGAPMLFIRLAPEREAGESRLILIAGANYFGLQVAEQLKAHREQFVLIDPDETRIQRAHQLGYEAIQGQLDSPDEAVVPYLERARALVCAHRDGDKNYRICQSVHVNFGLEHLVAQVTESGEIEKFRHLGVNTMNIAVDRAKLLALIARNPAVYNLLTQVDDDKEVIEIVVEDYWCQGKRIRDLMLPGDVLVLALRRNGELIIPRGNTQLECGDHLTLAGTNDSVDTARQMFSAIRETLL